MATTDKYPSQPDMARTIKELTSRVEKLERGANPNATVFYNSQGDVLLRAGKDPDTGDRGFTVGRETGSSALEIGATGPAVNQTIRMYDHAGQLILSDSETYGTGLRRPSISHNVTQVTIAPPAQTTTIYQTQGEAYFRKTNPSIEIVYNVFSSDGATGVSLRFKEGDTNTQLRPRYGISNYEIAHNPAPAGFIRVVTPALELPANIFNMGDQIRLIVEAYRFSGVGTFVVQVLAIRGSDEL